MTRFSGSYVSVFPWFWVSHTKKPLKHQDEEGDWSWPQGITGRFEPVVGSEYLMIHDIHGV